MVVSKTLKKGQIRTDVPKNEFRCSFCFKEYGFTSKMEIVDELNKGD